MIAVCGEALFDVFAAGQTASGLSLDARIGGSPFNVAVGLVRLGQPAALVTQVAYGFLGDRLMQALDEEGVAEVLDREVVEDVSDRVVAERSVRTVD